MEMTLDGDWAIRHDPLSQGLADGWWKHPADQWGRITIPAAWQVVLGESARGIVWFRRLVPVEVLEWLADPAARIMLRFDSVATDARVWVCGMEVGRHVGDYIPFELDVTEALRQKGAALEVIVRVDQYHAPRPAPGVVVENGHITKGFHDVLSLQHGGIWGSVSIRRTGPVAIMPMGVTAKCVTPSRVKVLVETTGTADVQVRAMVIDAAGRQSGVAELVAGAQGAWSGTIELSRSLPTWSPRTPQFAFLAVTVRRGDAEDERHVVRIAYRSLTVGKGEHGPCLMLNEEPIELRGILSWGHEPGHAAPVPSAEEVREEFTAIMRLGFNCICLCMFYAPDYVYDIADEMGLLIWQEHPVWKSRMSPEFMPEYHRLYDAFLRRDARHPCVVIVSGTCEHEAYDAQLAQWWWDAAKRRTSGVLLQIQTGFLEQTQPNLTDLYDDHVYDNAGRWVRFLADMHERIGELGVKPFVMGETIISNGWPDIKAMKAARTQPPQWWFSHGIDECEAFELFVERRAGGVALERFRRQAAAFGLLFRKFQAEVFRSMAANAGFVTNSVRDVAICRMGFKDDLDRWRFTPEQTQPWVGERIGLLRTPDHLRAFAGGSRIDVEYGVRGPGASSRLELVIAGDVVGRASVDHSAASAGWAGCTLRMPACDRTPGLVEVKLLRDGAMLNAWNLVTLPGREQLDGVFCLASGRVPAALEVPEFEERAYSSGWGLACRSWKPRLMRAAELFPGAASGESIRASANLVVTEQLTPQVHRHLRGGGRVLLLAQRNKQGMGSKWINLWGQVPYIVEDAGGPIFPGESEAVMAMLHHDLTKWTTRAVPVDQMKITEHVTPVMRYVYTHDNGAPNLHDAVFVARVEGGLLVVSCLDHTTDAGAFMLDRIASHAMHARIDEHVHELDIMPMLE